MSNAAAVSDAFVPFGPATLAAAKSGTAHLNVVPKEAAGETFSPLQTPGAAHQHGGSASGQPAVTLQRESERITGIRVECACGQVIELACSY